MSANLKKLAARIRIDLNDLENLVNRVKQGWARAEQRPLDSQPSSTLDFQILWTFVSRLWTFKFSGLSSLNSGLSRNPGLSKKEDRNGRT